MQFILTINRLQSTPTKDMRRKNYVSGSDWMRTLRTFSFSTGHYPVMKSTA